MRDSKFLTSNLIAHRGVHHIFVENSIPAIRRAMEENYIIELDVHITKDNVVVVVHDNNLKRVFGDDVLIKDLTWEEVRKYKFIPKFEEVLKLVNGRVPILIELKFDTKVSRLEKAVSKLLDKYDGKFAVWSFSPLSIFWFRLNRPHYTRGYLVNGVFPDNFLLRFFLNHRLLKKILKPDFIGVDKLNLEDREIQKLRDKYLILGYTIKTKLEHQKYSSYADNFVCDLPLK